MDQKRVLVTGMGAITPIGNTVTEFWDHLLKGQSGAAPITGFDASRHATQFACEVKHFDPTAHLDRKLVHRLDRYGHYAMVATQEALQQAGMDLTSWTPAQRERVGVVISSGIGGFQTVEQQTALFQQHGPRRISPFYIPMIITNMLSGIAALELGILGPSYSVASACATGNNALFDAWALIQLGYADVVVTGSSDACVTPSIVAGFNAAKALSTRNDDPTGASRPFDLDRDGFVIGEGAGILVLESMEHAQARGAAPLAEVLGFGLSTDAYHMTAPEPEGAGAARAMTDLLRRSGLREDDVDYVNMHGTSTKLGDIAETKALKKVFGDHAYRLKATSTKSMTGHMISAAASVEAIATILCIQHDRVPPTINRATPDPACDLDYNTQGVAEITIRSAVSNSFGFGGHNTSVAFAKAGWRDDVHCA